MLTVVLLRYSVLQTSLLDEIRHLRQLLARISRTFGAVGSTCRGSGTFCWEGTLGSHSVKGDEAERSPIKFRYDYVECLLCDIGVGLRGGEATFKEECVEILI